MNSANQIFDEVLINIIPTNQELNLINEVVDKLKILLEKAHVAAMPGSYFGDSGRGYIRPTIFQSKPVIQEALRRIKEVKDW